MQKKIRANAEQCRAHFLGVLPKNAPWRVNTENSYILRPRWISEPLSSPFYVTFSANPASYSNISSAGHKNFSKSHISHLEEPKMSQKVFLVALTIAIVLCMTVQAEAKRKSEDKINSWSYFHIFTVP